ncbi:MAG: hypothetical protein H5T59_05175 [Anaerolineae bacterium]|nr:hypothetical protein [Anaerolineae bacterium]
MEEAYRERIARLQERMAEQGVDVYLILTHDDYRDFIGDVRRQPRALIPREGEPILLVSPARWRRRGATRAWPTSGPTAACTR